VLPRLASPNPQGKSTEGLCVAAVAKRKWRKTNLFLAFAFFDCFIASIIFLSILEGVEVVLHLGHAVSIGDTLRPLLAGISSTIEVKLSKVFKDTGLLNVLLVVSILGGGFLVTDARVLRGRQTIRDVRVGADGSNLQL
jgi:hypothetical protein